MNLLVLHRILAVLILGGGFKQLADDMLSRLPQICQTFWELRSLIPRGAEHGELIQGYSGAEMDAFTHNAFGCVAMLSELYTERKYALFLLT